MAAPVEVLGRVSVLARIAAALCGPRVPGAGTPSAYRLEPPALVPLGPERGADNESRSSPLLCAATDSGPRSYALVVSPDLRPALQCGEERNSRSRRRERAKKIQATENRA